MSLGQIRTSNASRAFIYARARARLTALVLLAGSLVAPLAPRPAHAAPPAGTPIDNTATGTLTLASGPVTQPSNTVHAVVQVAEALALYPDRGGAAAPGGSVTLAHRLVNRGNAATDIRLDARNLGLDGFDASSFSLVEDRDHDGLVGPGDTPVANGGVITLAAGDSADVLFTLGLPGNAPLGALALVRLSATGLAQGAVALVTDTLRTPQVGMLPVLVFCDAPDYLRPTRVTGYGLPIQVEALARGCDLDPTSIEHVRITLSSQATGDRETFDATETTAHSGLFRVLPGAPTSTGLRSSAIGDGVLSTTRGDLVTAEIVGCGATVTRASVWVEPGGFVYESRSDKGVGGVRVRLIDVSGAGNGGRPGALASVYAGDGTTPSPAEVVTDANGAFSFPLVRRSTYRLDVVTPEAWSFPSRMGASSLPAARLTDLSGSYGGTFTTADSLAPIALDVPVDAVGSIALFVEQAASKPEVEWGDLAEWTIRVANRSDSTLSSVQLAEQLPFGFAYVRGSARTSAGVVSEPPGIGPSLAFALPALGPHESVELRLMTHVQPGAPTGDARAVAQASGSTAAPGAAPTVSNTAPATTRVRGDAFADEGGIVGTVSIRFRYTTRAASTSAADALADTPPVGLAGVRLYLDDGTWAVTDGQGRFSFTAITPRTHALKLDRTTLPPKSWPVSVDHRDAGTPGLRFVDLTRGDLAHAEFLIIADTASAPEVKDRMIAAGGRDEGGRLVAQSILRPEQRALPGDARSLPAAAIVTGEREAGEGTPRRTPQAAPIAPVRPALAASDSNARPIPIANLDEDLLPDGSLAEPPAARVPPATATAPPPANASLEQLLPTLDPGPGFIGLADMDTVASAQLRVLVKGPLGSTLGLLLNGERVPETRVGRRVTAPTRGLEAWEYVGITLVPGVNVLELSLPNMPGRVAVRVVAPGATARLWLSGPGTVPADGHSERWYTLSVTDSAGVPVTARTLVTLDASRGLVPLEDLDPGTPGLQIAVEGGHARVPLLSPTSPGRAEVTATSGTMRAVADVDFVPEMRPLLVVGTFEGALGVDAVHAPASGRTPRDGFEQPISEFLSESQDGSRSAGARAALYVKGRVRNDMELTLGYDSDRPDDMRQFRDLQVDRGYPVQGDASVRGYDAQSTGKLYGRLERHDATLLYGDVMTGGSDLSLSNYARSLTGAVVSWSGDDTPGGVPSGRAPGAAWSGHAFTSRERSHQTIDELPGRGVSGPYRLSRTPLVENSERVEVLVRDRDQPAVVISTELKQRFTDYELDPLSGELVFKAPVPSFDADLNPVSVRVTYEIHDATGAAWVSGLQLSQRVSSGLTLGGTYVDDHDPAQPFELRGLSARTRLTQRTTLEGEWAATHALAGTGTGLGGASTGGVGDAGRIELRHDDPVTQARLWAMTAATGFANPGAGLAGGHTEAGGRWSTRLAERTRLTGEALYSADVSGQTKRGGLLVSLDRTLSEAWRAELGTRVAGESNATLPEDPLEATVRLKMLGQWPSHPEWSGYGEYEQDTQIASRRLAALGGEYHFSSRGRVYARHELASSLSGAWALSESQQRLATVAGIDADLARDAHVFSEYRLADALAGREGQAAVGLRNAWRLSNGMRVGGSFERVNPLAGAPSHDGPSTALTGSVDWAQDPRWKGSLRMEGRTSRESDQVLQSMAAAVKLDPAWTGLVRHQFTVGGSRQAGTMDADEHFEMAMAYRDPGGDARPAGRWDALGRWEFIMERPPGTTAGPVDVLPGHHVANVIGLNATTRFSGITSANLGWAGKLTREETPAAITRGLAQWLHGRLMRDIGRDWDASVTGSVRTGASLADRQFGLGLEIGRQLPGGMWLSAGFNRFGYRDDELTDEEWTRTGGFIRMRARFDESLFHRVGGGR